MVRQMANDLGGWGCEFDNFAQFGGLARLMPPRLKTPAHILRKSIPYDSSVARSRTDDIAPRVFSEFAGSVLITENRRILLASVRGKYAVETRLPFIHLRHIPAAKNLPTLRRLPEVHGRCPGRQSLTGTAEPVMIS